MTMVTKIKQFRDILPTNVSGKLDLETLRKSEVFQKNVSLSSILIFFLYLLLNHDVFKNICNNSMFLLLTSILYSSLQSFQNKTASHSRWMLPMPTALRLLLSIHIVENFGNMCSDCFSVSSPKLRVNLLYADSESFLKQNNISNFSNF